MGKFTSIATYLKHKAEVLYEELAHHKLTYGNILDQSKWINRKFESYARRHGYEAALPYTLLWRHITME